LTRRAHEESRRIATFALESCCRFRLGARSAAAVVASATRPDGDGGVAVGAHVEMESPGSHWHLQPNVLYWNGDPLTGFNGNLDALYHFGPQARTSPYLGGGLGFSMVDFPGNGGSETDLGANLIGGVMFPSGRNSLFIEGRHTISDVSQTSILFGITVR
jgi:hypothetical protein